MFRLYGWRFAVVLCLAMGLGGAGTANGAAGRIPPAKVPATRASGIADLDAALQRLAAEADHVFLGRCLAVEDLSPGSPGGAPGRLATFLVERTFKGPERDWLTLRYRARGGVSAPGAKRAPAAWSEEELRRYAPPGGLVDVPGRGGRPDPEEKDAARQVRRDRLRHLPPSRGTPAGRAPAPPAFHRDERALVFLPRLGDGGFLRTGAPGFAKLLVVEMDGEGAFTLVPVAGPGWLTAPAAVLGPSAPPLDRLLEELQRRLEEAAAGIRPGEGRSP